MAVDMRERPAITGDDAKRFIAEEKRIDLLRRYGRNPVIYSSSEKNDMSCLAGRKMVIKIVQPKAL